MSDDDIMKIVLQAMETAGQLHHGLGSGQCHYVQTTVLVLANSGIETFQRIKREQAVISNRDAIQAYDREC